MQRTLLLALIAIGIVTATSDAEARRRGDKNQENPVMLVQSCFACHGPEGSGVMSPMPNIGGQPPVYLNLVLKSFRDGQRQATIMDRIMKGYTDSQIQAMANHLSTLPYQGNKQAVDAALIATGKDMYERGCKKCHPQSGREGSDPEYPKLAGQWIDYMEGTLKEILDGKRQVDEKFSTALNRRSPEELKALVHYFASQE